MAGEKPSHAEEAFGGPLSIHFFYVVLILVLAIILLATQNWTSIQGFTDYLTAAGTMTSLVLAVLAIIYSVVSSRQQGDVIGSIESSSRNISQVVGQLNELTESAQSLQRRAEDRTESLVTLVSQLKDSVGTLQDSNRELAEKSTEIVGRVQTVQSRLDNLDAQPKVQSVNSLAAASLDPIAKAVGTASLLGLCIAMLVVEAHKQKKRFSVEAFAKAGDTTQEGYLHGFMMAWDCAGFFDTESVREGGAMRTRVNSVSPHIGALVDAEWKERLESAAPDRKARMIRYREAVDSALLDD